MADKVHEPGGCSQFLFLTAALTVFVGYFFRGEILDGEDPGIGYFLIVSIVATSIGSLGSLTMSVEQRAHQWSRDLKAKQILGQVHTYNQSAQGFGVYLRPFFTTGQLPCETRNRKPMFPILPGYHEARAQPAAADLEAIMTKALEPLGPLIAIGKPGEQIGAGRVKSHVSWRDDVAQLIADASFVVCIPSDRPGTAWEIELIMRRNLLNKCVFLMPPRPSFSGINVSDAWERTRLKLADRGLKLPKYDEQGLLFSMTVNGELGRRYDLDLKSHRSILKAVRNHETGRTRNGAPAV